MRKPNTGRVVTPGLAAAMAMALALAGCAAVPSAKPDETVRVAKAERASFNAPPEPNLFQIAFGPERTREIRWQTGQLAMLSELGGYGAEIAILEREAERELRARSLCTGSAKLVPPIIVGEGSPEIRALFRCRPPLLN